MLTVKSLGKFELSDGMHVMNDEVLRSDMVKKLLMYMLIHRGHPVAVAELSEALWQEDEVDNPAGALKNLMYRLRTLMKKSFGDTQFLITSQGAYAWNSEIEVDFDAERFEAYYKKSKSVKTKEERTACYESAVTLYRGEFMENALNNHWAVTLATYYHSMFLNSVKSLAELYMEQGRYQDVEDVSVYALKMDTVDEELHCYHIMALIKQNKYELAMKRYEEAAKTLYDALGVRNSAKLQNVQKELLKMSKGNEAESLEHIHDDMVEEEDSVGVYFCGYPVFREIYRLEVRKNSRLGEAEYIVLFTVEINDGVKTNNEKMERFIIEQGMSKLKNTLGKVLRIGDVAARYSDSQYIVLLPTCTYESSILVAKRVLENFAASDKSKKVRIKTDFEQLSEIKSTLVR
ncbi:MAG: hypothetical protein IJ274_00960 [Lachnospiraceae bacterium]|nr:hypothetical protein [Lachnospiraceae bacterium]